MCGGAQGGGSLSPTDGGQLGRRACPHSGGRRWVAGERGPAGSGRVRGSEARGMRGLAREGNGVGRARMNIDDFKLFKQISNKLEWF
jgi:hypothetical protein